MSHYQSAYRIQRPRTSRLKALATTTAVAGLLIAGSTGIAVAATSSSALPASASGPIGPGLYGGGNDLPYNCGPGYVLSTGLCVLPNR